MHTTDGGKSWRGLPAPKAYLAGSTSSARTVSAIRFADASDGWVAGGALYSTHNGGGSWHKQSLAGNPGSVGWIATGGGHAYALVTSGRTGGKLFATAINRDHWVPVGTVSGSVGDLAVTGSNYFVSTSAGVYHGVGTVPGARLANPCASLHTGNRAGSGGIVAKLAAVDAKHVDAMCAFDGATAMESYQLFGSTDGGKHWTKAGRTHVLSSGFTGIADNGHGVLLVAVASGGSYLERTTNDGKSFHRASVSAPSGGYSWSEVGFTTSTQAVAVLPAHGLYLSHDSGASFGKINF